MYSGTLGLIGIRRFFTMIFLFKAS